jgi:hypothetical protein
MNEQRRNLIENKGLLWKSWQRTGNVIENTGSYTPEPGMLLKTKWLVAGGWELDLPVRDDYPLPERGSSPAMRMAGEQIVGPSRRGDRRPWPGQALALRTPLRLISSAVVGRGSLTSALRSGSE